MIFEDSNLKIHRIEYKIVFDSEREIASITPIIHAESVRPNMLLAAVRVDDHELLPSAKVMLAAGVNAAALKPVKIVRPFLCVADACAASYKMTLELFWCDGTSSSWNEMIEIQAF